MCLLVCVYATCLQVQTKARRCCKISWSWGYTEPPNESAENETQISLQEHHMLFAAEPSLQPIKCFFTFILSVSVVCTEKPAIKMCYSNERKHWKMIKKYCKYVGEKNENQSWNYFLLAWLDSVQFTWAQSVGVNCFQSCAIFWNRILLGVLISLPESKILTKIIASS